MGYQPVSHGQNSHRGQVLRYERVETPEGPLGQAAVEGEGDGGGTRLLADTRVGCMVALRPLGDNEGEEGGPAPP